MIAALRAAISHFSGKRPATRTDLGTGGTAGRTVPAVHQARQVFLLAVGQQVRTVRRTEVARTLAVRTGFGTLLHHRIDLRFRGLGLMGKRLHADDGESTRQRHCTDSAEHSILHSKLPFQRDCHRRQATESVVSAQVTETKKADLTEPLCEGFRTAGLLFDQPPRPEGGFAAHLVFRDQYNTGSLSEKQGSQEMGRRMP